MYKILSSELKNPNREDKILTRSLNQDRDSDSETGESTADDLKDGLFVIDNNLENKLKKTFLSTSSVVDIKTFICLTYHNDILIYQFYLEKLVILEPNLKKLPKRVQVYNMTYLVLMWVFRKTKNFAKKHGKFTTISEINKKDNQDNFCIDKESKETLCF